MTLFECYRNSLVKKIMFDISEATRKTGDKYLATKTTASTDSCLVRFFKNLTVLDQDIVDLEDLIYPSQLHSRIRHFVLALVTLKCVFFHLPIDLVENFVENMLQRLSVEVRLCGVYIHAL